MLAEVPCSRASGERSWEERRSEQRRSEEHRRALATAVRRRRDPEPVSDPAPALDLDEPPAPIDLVAEFSAEDHERLAAIEAGVLHRQRVYRGERRRAPHPHPWPVVWEKRNGRIYVAGETQARGRLSCMLAWEPPSLSAVCFYHKDGGLCSVTSDINDRCETMLCEWIASAHLYDSSVAHREHRPEGLRARIR